MGMDVGSRGVCSLQRDISDSNIKVLYMRTVPIRENQTVSMHIPERKRGEEGRDEFKMQKDGRAGGL